jgi:hypothetical protein
VFNVNFGAIVQIDDEADLLQSNHGWDNVPNYELRIDVSVFAISIVSIDAGVHSKVLKLNHFVKLETG